MRFFVLRNADFVKFRHASELSWQKVLLIRVLYREQVQWWSLETWSRSRDVSRDPFFGVSVSKVSGLVSVSKDFGLVLELFVSRFCIGYFLWSFARSSYSKKRVWKMIVQNLALQRGQWLSFLCCYVVCEMEKTICPVPRLEFVLNSIKNVHVPVKPQRVISAKNRKALFCG